MFGQVVTRVEKFKIKRQNYELFFVAFTTANNYQHMTVKTKLT